VHDERGFWLAFLTGTAVVLVLIVASGFAGVTLLARRMSEAGSRAQVRTGSCSGPGCGIPPPPPAIAFVPPYAPPPVAPPTPDLTSGALDVDLEVTSVRGRPGVRAGDRCTLALDFAGDASGEALCSGRLDCEDTEVWSGTFACRASRDGLSGHGTGDREITVLTTPDGAHVTVLEPGGRRGFFVLVADRAD
jgi:hypothetical protein